MTIAEALLESERKLDAYKRKHPKTKDMACTLALTQIQDDSIAIACVGDSRVYQFRNGRILFKTFDHSWVSEAVQKGIISPVEALFHPNSHELTRSIKGSQHPVSIEQVIITDVKAGDYFLLCTDGILESWIDSDLEELFLITEESPYYTQKIAENCKRYSKDNYTAVVFQIGI
jgi:protein phosphatase